MEVAVMLREYSVALKVACTKALEPGRVITIDVELGAVINETSAVTAVSRGTDLIYDMIHDDVVVEAVTHIDVMPVEER
jgi:hypothetical protein